MRYTLLLLSALFSAKSLAQNSSQADLPPCLLQNCEDAATQATGCADTDVECHCENQGPIYQVILPCAQQFCADPSESVQEYNQLFGGACSQYNISVPAPGTVGPISNGTASVLPSGIGTSASGFATAIAPTITPASAFRGTPSTALIVLDSLMCLVTGGVLL